MAIPLMDLGKTLYKGEEGILRITALLVLYFMKTRYRSLCCRVFEHQPPPPAVAQSVSIEQNTDTDSASLTQPLDQVRVRTACTLHFGEALQQHATQPRMDSWRG